MFWLGELQSTVWQSWKRLSDFHFPLVSQRGWELTVVLKLPPVGKLASPRVMQAA